MAATYIKCTWIKGSHFFHPNIYFMNGAWRKCLHESPTLAGCSTQSWRRKNAADGLNSNSSEFPCHWTSTTMWTMWWYWSDQRCNGVCSRESTTNKTTLRASLVLIWFDDSPHSNQRIDKTIGPATDYRDQSMKISSFLNTHYPRISLCCLA